MERLRSIVVPTDFSPLSEAAATRAAALARLDGAAVHLVHALHFPIVATPYAATVSAEVWEGIRRAAGEHLEEARKATEEKLGQTVTAEISEASDAVEAISAAVEAHRADLVVMGTHGFGGLKHAFLGSVAERTLRAVDRPILVVKDEPATAAEAISRILLAVDFSVHSDRAVELTAGLAKRLGASVDVVHAFDLPRDYDAYTSSFGAELEERIRESADERLEGVRARLAQSELRVTLHARRGPASLVIAEVAKEIDCQLIVMGTRGNSGLKHILLGSVAERTIRGAPCSVLATKASEPRSLTASPPRTGR